jgi:P pilus assembly chaperone PapD
MRKRLLTIICVLLLCVATLAWATHESNNALASSEVSATVAFADAKYTFTLVNGGPDPVYVKVWMGNDTPAAITTATSGAFKVNSGESVTWQFAGGYETGIGYRGFSHICAAGLTATSRWWAK